MKFIKGFGQFWYEFIIGDDWKIAAAVVIGLAISVAGLKAKILGDGGLAVAAAALIVVLFSLSLIIDVRPRRARGDHT
jgi:hypothetical protein